MSHAAFSWIHKQVLSLTIIFSSVAKFGAAIESRGKALTDDKENYLDELYKPKAVHAYKEYP